MTSVAQTTAKFEKGKPADPTLNMSTEDTAKWKAMNDEHGDKFKEASEMLDTKVATSPMDAAKFADAVAKRLASLLPNGNKMRTMGVVSYGEPERYISLISGVGGANRDFAWIKPAYYQPGSYAPGHGFKMYPRSFNKSWRDNGGQSPAAIAREIAAVVKSSSFAKAAADDVDEKGAKFEEGKPADPTKNMSAEDAAEWKRQNEKNKDKFKTAAGPKLTPDQIKEVQKEMKSGSPPVRFMSKGQALNIQTGQLSGKGGNVMHQVVYWDFPPATAKKIQGWLGGDVRVQKSAADDVDEKGAKFEKGKPADPTKNMSAEDAAEWKQQNEANKDKFKTAGSDNGWTTFTTLVNYRNLVKIRGSLRKVDRQSSDLLREVMSKISDELQISRGALEALNRLRGIAENGSSWDPALLRNNIFKAANSLGIRLPSGMFASSAMGQLALMDLDLVEASLNGVPLDRSLRSLEATVRDAAISRAAQSQVGKIIHEQMGGRRLNMMLGIYYLKYIPDGMEFGFPNKQRSKGNHVKITLRGDDTYTVEFLSTTWTVMGRRRFPAKSKSIKKVNGVHADMLVDTFESQTGWYVRMASDTTVAAFEELMGIEATFNEGSRIPDGWDSGYIEDDPEATESDEGSDTPDGSGNLSKRAAKSRGEGLNGYNSAVGWQDKGDEKRALTEYTEAAKQIGMSTANFSSMPLGKVQSAVKAELEKRSKAEGVSYTLKTPKRAAEDKEAAGIEMWVAVTNDGKFLGAQEGANHKNKGAWSNVKRTKGKEFNIQLATSVPMNVAENMLDWGFNNPKTNFWKDEATAFINVKRYINKGKQAAGRAPSGMYGHTKRVQADCEVSVRKVQREATRIAQAIHGKNPKVAAFLATHAKRADSLPAKIIMAAMEGMGPKFAEETKRAVRLAELRDAQDVKTAAPRGKAQKALMEHIGQADSGFTKNLSDISRDKAFIGVHFAKILSAAEALKKQGLIEFDGVKVTKKASSVTRFVPMAKPVPLRVKNQIMRRLERMGVTVTPGREGWELKGNPRMLDAVEPLLTQGRIAKTGDKWIIMKSSRARDDFDVTERNAYGGPAADRAGVKPSQVYTDKKKAEADAKKMAKANPVGFTVVRLASVTAKVSDSDSQGEGIKQTIDKKANARGLYGYGDKVASMGLNACSEIRGCAGRIAFDLHRRRSAKHAAITAYLDSHCKTAKCMHSRLLSASYPSADTKVAALQPPRTVVGWLAWED